MSGLVVAVFLLTYLGMAVGRVPGLQVDRTGIALVAAIVLIATGAVTPERALAAVDLPTLLVLFGLMILSAQFAVAGFYDWCAARMAAARLGPAGLLALVVAVGGGLSAVLANDVVVFAMTPMLCAGLARRSLDPRPYVLGLAAAANAGSAATAIGNPQNILIAQAGGLDFWAFLLVCGPPAVAGLLCVHAVVWSLWRRRWLLTAAPAGCGAAAEPFDRAMTAKGGLAAVLLLGLFMTPLAQAESVALVAGALLVSRRMGTRKALGMVDWPLLVLFAGLFIVTEGLTATGLPRALVAAAAGAGVTLDSLPALAGLTLLGSNLIGNVPADILLLSMLPGLDAGGLHALALLSTLAGNLLLTGSLANLIAVERAAQAGVRIGFWEHARCGVPITLASLGLALGWLAWWQG